MDRGLLARLRVRAAAQDGITLIEVLVSAVLLVAIITGVLGGFDASLHFTTDEQHKSAATALAQQDEDRLRGLPVTTLSGLDSTSTTTLNGTIFTIHSMAQFVNAKTGATSCSATGTADYISTRSIVSWNNANNSGQVEQEEVDGIVTPGAGGSLTIDTYDSQGTGVPGMTVTASGPSPGGTTYTATTSSTGCAIFAGLPGGDYTVSVSQGGYVTPSGASSAQATVTVVETSNATQSFTFDRPGSLTAYFYTDAYGILKAVQGDALTLSNPGIPGMPKQLWLGQPGSPSSTVTASNLFPFSSGYTYYPGSCQGDDPTAYVSKYKNPTVTLAPGGSATLGPTLASKPAAIWLPALDITVWSGTDPKTPGLPVSNASVVVTDQNCGGSPPVQGGSPQVKRTLGPTDVSGHVPNPGLPYGIYTVCAQGLLSGSLVSNATDWLGSKKSATSVTNNSPTGTPVDLYLGNGATGLVSGACP